MLSTAVFTAIIWLIYVHVIIIWIISSIHLYCLIITVVMVKVGFDMFAV